MLLEATIAMFVLMGITWIAAIYASYSQSKEPQQTVFVVRASERKAA